MFKTSRIRLIAASLLLASSFALAQDRAHPLPLPGTELKGALRPGVRSETYYAAEASGSLDFTLTVTSVQDLALLEVEVLDTSFVPLFKFDVSSATPGGTERREAKCKLDGKQVVILRLNAPSANKSGSYNLKIKGNIEGTTFKGAPVVANAAANPNKAAAIENWSELLKQEEKNKTPEAPSVIITPRDASKTAAVASAVSNAAIKEIGADKRLALVIGNSAYDSQPLKNPVNDARAMAEALAECGFEVMLLENATKRRMEEAIRSFGAKLTPTDQQTLIGYLNGLKK